MLADDEACPAFADGEGVDEVPNRSPS